MPFRPPFCPHRDCPSHQYPHTSTKSWFQRRGFRSTAVVGPVQMFRCKLCRRGFSARTFSVDYWTHKSIDYQLVQNLLVGGSGLRQSSRTLGVSTRLLANRHHRLARQTMALQSQSMDDFHLREPLAFDGFESFAFSQYYPNNIHLLATSDSQFVLGINAAILRRKGRMTEKQKDRRSNLERSYRAPKNAILNSCQELLSHGCDLSLAALQLPIELRTDEKKEYGWALSRLRPYGEWREAGLLVHTKVSSRLPRTSDNPLFTVNYLDRQLRKDLAEHVRETVRFARRIEHSLERVVIHLGHHNFWKRFRIRGNQPRLTHAECAGLDPQRVADLRKRAMLERAFGWRCDLEDWQRSIWRRSLGVPVHRVTPLAKHFQTA